jgi:CTP synthase
MGKKMLEKLGLVVRRVLNWDSWGRLVEQIAHLKKKIRIAIVGKYFDSGNFALTDSYVSVIQALIHAGAKNNIGIEMD